jgi:hypothetical protein
MVTLRAKMHSLFEYMHNPFILKKGFEDFVHRLLKGKKFHLKHLFTNKGQQTCPLGIKPTQWQCLTKYWADEKTIVKASTIFNGQGNKKKMH